MRPEVLVVDAADRATAENYGGRCAGCGGEVEVSIRTTWRKHFMRICRECAASVREQIQQAIERAPAADVHDGCPLCGAPESSIITATKPGFRDRRGCRSCDRWLNPWVLDGTSTVATGG